jgi:threonine dehydratase
MSLVSIQDILTAQRRLRPYLDPTPMRRYPLLEREVGNNLAVWVKHENMQPTGSFKARNALNALLGLSEEARSKGVVAATRGNHGQGLAWAGSLLGTSVTICVPRGNNPEKNAAMLGFGATLIEEGRDYDEAVQIAETLVKEKGYTLVHSTNNSDVLAGAATMTFELLQQEPSLDALVVSVGGGSQAVGALSAVRSLAPWLNVYGVQAENASAIHDSWHAGRPVHKDSADTFADGLATRHPYEATFASLCEGLTDFVTVSEAEIAEAVRVYLRTTHHLAEGAGAASLAGLITLRDRLAGQRVGVILSGGNIDQETLRRVVTRSL